MSLLPCRLCGNTLEISSLKSYLDSKSGAFELEDSRLRSAGTGALISSDCRGVAFYGTTSGHGGTNRWLANPPLAARSAIWAALAQFFTREERY